MKTRTLEVGEIEQLVLQRALNLFMNTMEDIDDDDENYAVNPTILRRTGAKLAETFDAWCEDLPSEVPAQP